MGFNKDKDNKMPEQIILFDLPGKDGHAWSLNPWKTRMVLNFKGLEYKTEWVEYPDIEPRLSPHVPPNPPPGRAYSIPTVQIPSDGSYLSDSKLIAEKLESLHPSPPLHLDSPILPEIYDIIPKAMSALRGAVMPKIPRNLLNPRSVEYFERTREKAFGMKLEELEVRCGGEQAWRDGEKHILAIGEILKRKGGPYFLGETPSYADFIIVGFLQFLHRIDKEALYDRVVKIEPAYGRLYDACGEWLKRDDY